MEAGKEVKEVQIDDPKMNEFCSHTFSMKEEGLVRVEPFNQILRVGYMKHHQTIQNFKVFEDDVWLCTFPKSGKLI